MKISTNLLMDTYHLLQLARETALAQGHAERAERLSPVVDGLRNLVIQSHEPGPTQPTGVLAEQDFQALLSIATRTSSPINAGGTSQERYQMVLTMAAANTSETEIARHLGMTLEEVRTLLQIAQPRPPYPAEAVQ